MPMNRVQFQKGLSLPEFMDRYGTEEQCEQALVAARWPGGFVCPVIFGYLLQATGLWTSCWMFFLVLIAVCLIWMHLVIQRMMKTEAPELARRIE